MLDTMMVSQTVAVNARYRSIIFKKQHNFSLLCIITCSSHVQNLYSGEGWNSQNQYQTGTTVHHAHGT